MRLLGLRMVIILVGLPGLVGCSVFHRDGSPSWIVGQSSEYPSNRFLLGVGRVIPGRLPRSGLMPRSLKSLRLKFMLIPKTGKRIGYLRRGDGNQASAN